MRPIRWMRTILLHLLLPCSNSTTLSFIWEQAKPRTSRSWTVYPASRRPVDLTWRCNQLHLSLGQHSRRPLFRPLPWPQ
jgi:hypothetical protein